VCVGKQLQWSLVPCFRCVAVLVAVCLCACVAWISMGLSWPGENDVVMLTGALTCCAPFAAAGRGLLMCVRVLLSNHSLTHPLVVDRAASQHLWHCCAVLWCLPPSLRPSPQLTVNTALHTPIHTHVLLAGWLHGTARHAPWCALSLSLWDFQRPVCVCVSDSGLSLVRVSVWAFPLSTVPL